MSRVVVITPPAAEPVTLTEAKAHLRVDINDDNDLISSLIVGAREAAEGFTGRALVTQTLELMLDAAPKRYVWLPRPPLQSVTSIKFIDRDGGETTVSADDYVVDTSGSPGLIMLKAGASWPAVTLREVGGVRIRYVAGYGAGSAVPARIRQAILLDIGTHYENREGVLVAQGVTVMALPGVGVHDLLRPYRVTWRF